MLKIYGASAEEKKIIKNVAKATYAHFGQKDIFFAEITIVSPDEIQATNKAERDVDKVTDVLSFPEQNIAGSLPVAKLDFDDGEKVDGKVLLGSIMICRTRAEEQAREYGHSIEREIGFLTVHGLLHVLGFDHVEPNDEKVMRAYQREILDSAGYSVK